MYTVIDGTLFVIQHRFFHHPIYLGNDINTVLKSHFRLLQLLQTAQQEWCLQFVVRNEFKSLIHLQLLIGHASDCDLINFMSNKIQHLTVRH